MSSYLLQRIDSGPLARLDFRVKLTFLLLASTLIFAWNGVVAQTAMLAAVVLFLIAAGVRPKTVGTLTLISLPALILITIIQGLFSPFGVTPVFHVPAWVPWIGSAVLFTTEGLLFGLVVCCRVLVPMLAFQYLFMTTEPNEIVLGLTRLRVPYRVALLVSTTFRFVPLLLEEFGAIKDAQKLRGIDLESYGVGRKLVALGRMLVPLITGCMTKGQAMEIALQARGFTGSADRTSLHPLRAGMTLAEWGLTMAGLGFLAAAITARLVYGIGARVL